MLKFEGSVANPKGIFPIRILILDKTVPPRQLMQFDVGDILFLISNIPIQIVNNLYPDKVKFQMVKIRPFKGFLANKNNVGKVISPAYDVLNTVEACEMADGNPMSFLHVNKPEIDLPKDTDPYDDAVYQKGRENLLSFIEKGYLVEDPVETMYIYRQVLGNHTQQGIVSLTSIEDYEQNKIKRHEFTMPKKELDRTKLTDIQCANVGPVFFTFRENQEAIKARISSITEGTAPYGDVVCNDDDSEVRHVLWRCSVADSEYFQKAFAEISALYVADGHHRTQAAFNVGKMAREKAIAAG